MKGWQLSDMPASVQADIRAKLAAQKPVKPVEQYDDVQFLAKKKLNSTEREYLALLEMRIRDGTLAYICGHESVKFRIGEVKCWYHPDFCCIRPTGRLEIHEVKGPKVWDDARVKFQSAALQFPGFLWFWAQRDKQGVWTTTQYGGDSND